MLRYMADFSASPAVLRKLFCFATAVVTPPADGAASGASPASGGDGGSSPSPGAGAPTGSSPNPAPNPNDANIRTLREGYDKYSQLGKYDELAPMVQGYRTLASKAQEIAQGLGYSAESVLKALQSDPVATLQRLAAEAAQRPPADPNDPPDVESLINEKVAPITEYMARQQATVAAGRFDSTFNDLFSNHPEFKGASDIPADVRQVLYDMTSESFKYDKEGMQALLKEGKTAAVQKMFDGVMERFLKVVNGYQQWKTGRSGQPANPNPAAPPVKLSLDDIISGNKKATDAIPSMRPRA